MILASLSEGSVVGDAGGEITAQLDLLAFSSRPILFFRWLLVLVFLLLFLSTTRGTPGSEEIAFEASPSTSNGTPGSGPAEELLPPLEEDHFLSAIPKGSVFLASSSALC